ncbi:hypothetical protein, conserved [Eimeria praecox]|uniref:Uncharacterized protein n=1 Tax=Eimeria praecox TaxID=51316 RepID=U6G6C4_9EIME|nr:hypothetical protein, conserved [Eimeria praecox]
MVSIDGAPEKVQDACWTGTAEGIATYLQETVATTLAEGIAATIKAQPEDPPIFLSRWLLKYVEEQQKQLKLQLRSLSVSEDEVIEALRGVEWVEEETLVKVLNHLKGKLGATGVYLAKYEEQVGSKEEDPTPVLRYIAANDSHSYMLNYCLHEEEGLTWDLLQDDESNKEREGPSNDSKEEGSEDEEALFAEVVEDRRASCKIAGANIGRAVTRKSLIVEEVLDNPRIHFFGLTRPGSYIAVSMELNEVANADSVMALFNWMKETQAREAASSPSQEQEDTGSSAGGESGLAPAHSEGLDGTEGESNEEEDTLDETHTPLAPPELRSSRAKYVLCADSLGQETSLGQEALGCLRLFAEEIGTTIVRTQRETVERQAAELLNSSEQKILQEQLSELQQNCSLKVQALQEQRQSEALQLLDEQEAEEMAEAERQRHEQQLRKKENAEAGKTEEEMELRKEGEDEGDGLAGADSLSNQGESDTDGKSEEEIFVPPPLSRKCVLEAIAAHAALEAFNEEVLTPFKQNIALSRQYIADTSTLVSAAAACALLLGYEAKTLKLNSVGKEGLWNWNRLRQLLTPAFGDAMMAFDPKAPRHYKDKENGLHFIMEMLNAEFQSEEEQSQKPLESLLSSWVTCAVNARKTELVLQREKLRRAASMQHAPPPEISALIELDPDFECIEDSEF